MLEDEGKVWVNEICFCSFYTIYTRDFKLLLFHTIAMVIFVTLLNDCLTEES